MEKQRNDDIFNPEYGKKKPFIRKENIKKIIVISIFIALFLYGSIDYINDTVVRIEIRTVTDRKIDSVLFIDGRCDIFIINRSPFKIELVVDDSIITNYDGRKLLPNVKYYFWFESNNTETLNIGGVKG